MPLNIGSTYTVMMKGLDGLRAAFEVGSLTLVSNNNDNSTLTSNDFNTSLSPNSALIFGLIEVFYGSIGLIFLLSTWTYHLCVNRELGMTRLAAERNRETPINALPGILVGLSHVHTPNVPNNNCLFSAVRIAANWDNVDARYCISDYLTKVTNNDQRLTEDQTLTPEQIKEFVTEMHKGSTRDEYINAINNGTTPLGDVVHEEIIMRALRRPIIKFDGLGSIINRTIVNRYQQNPIFVYYNQARDHYDPLTPNDGVNTNHVLTSALVAPPAQPYASVGGSYPSCSLFCCRAPGNNQPLRGFYQEYFEVVSDALVGGKQSLRLISYLLSLAGSSLLLSTVENPQGIKAAVAVVFIAVSLFLTRVDITQADTNHAAMAPAPGV